MAIIPMLTIFLLQLALFPAIAQVHVVEYYVVATAGVPEPCPTSKDVPCNNLSHYFQQPLDYFNNNTIFLFLRGTHEWKGLDKEQHGWLLIDNVANLSLFGMGGMEPGRHETAMQTPVIIDCSNNSGGIAIVNSINVSVHNITMTGCGAVVSYANLNENINYTCTLLFKHIGNLTLQFCSVQNSSGYGFSAVDVYPTQIIQSSFINNGARGLNTSLSAKEHSLPLGGNAILTFGSEQEQSSPSCPMGAVDIINSNFSFGYGSLGGGISILLSSKPHIEYNISMTGVTVHSNNGGGAAVSVTIEDHVGIVSVTIEDSVIKQNNLLQVNLASPVGSYGGGLYFHTESLPGYIGCLGRNITQKLSILRSKFIDNYSDSGAGAYIDWAARTSGTVVIESCIFTGNVGRSGIGLYIQQAPLVGIPSPYMNLANISFCNNGPSNWTNIDRVTSVLYVCNVNDLTITDMKVVNNNASGLLNAGSAIALCGDQLQFINNTAFAGGGISVYSGGMILVGSNTKLLFQGNHALYKGGGLYVHGLESSLSDAPCFYQYYLLQSDDYVCPIIEFEGNSARVTGNAMYGGIIEPHDCMLYYNYTAEKQLDNCSLFECVPSACGREISSDADKVCFCDSKGNQTTMDCDKRSESVSVYPGEDVIVDVALAGQCNGITDGVLLIVNGIHVKPESISANCTHLNITPQMHNDYSTTVFISVEGEKHQEAVSLNVTFQPCPPELGFSLKDGLCQCIDSLAVLGGSCNISDHTISTPNETWIGFYNDSEMQCVMTYPSCPFDYCQYNHSSLGSFSLHDPDIQCALNRSGWICGECLADYSLRLGSNACWNCTNSRYNYLIAVPLIGIGGLLLTVFIMLLNLTVTTGTINSLIFYANIVKLYEDIFFPDKPIPFISMFIAWLNLDFGFPLCFYDGMTASEKAALQFVFPVYLWVLIFFIIYLSKKSTMVSMFLGSRITPVLATLLLLSYNKLLRSIIFALYVTHIPCHGKPDFTVWYVNANIEYLHHSGHIVVFTLGLIFLCFFGIPYTLFLLAIPVFEGSFSTYPLFRYFSKMKPLLDSYGGPYKDRYRIWTGILLVARIILALSVSLLDNRTYSLIVMGTVMIVLMVTLSSTGGVYHLWHLNALEQIAFANLLLLAFLQDKHDERRSKGISTIGMIVSASICIVLFIAIIVYHCHQFAPIPYCAKKILPCKKSLLTRLTNQFRGSGKTNKAAINISEDSVSDITGSFQNITYSYYGSFDKLREPALEVLHSNQTLGIK